MLLVIMWERGQPKTVIHSKSSPLSSESTRFKDFSLPGIFAPWNESSREQKFPGTFVPGSECSREHSFRGAIYQGANCTSNYKFTHNA